MLTDHPNEIIIWNISAHRFHRAVRKATRLEGNMLGTKTLLALSVFLFSVGTNCQEMYRWTDQSGRIHYSDSVPESQKQKAKAIDLSRDSLSDAQRRDAEARFEKEKSRLQARTKAKDAVPSASAIGENKTPPANQPDSCEQQWQKYAESVACFNPYRTRNGTKAEGYANCTETTQPSCLRPQ